MKLVARWEQVAAASEVRICQVRAPFWVLLPQGDLAGDDRWAQLAFSEIIGGIYAVVIQKGKEMIALFVEPFTDGFFAGLAALNGFIFEGQTPMSEDFRVKVSFLLLECDSGTQHGPPVRKRSPRPVEDEGLWRCGWLCDDGRNISVGMP
jgi:hypothetical protein